MTSTGNNSGGPLFKYEARETEFSGGIFVLQAFCVSLLLLIVGGILTSIASELLGGLTGGIAAYFIAGLIGFGLGYWVQITFPRSRACGGLWIWIFPVVVFLWAIFTDMRLGFNDELTSLFIAANARRGPTFGFLTLTSPALATVFYSVGVLKASRKLAKSA